VALNEAEAFAAAPQAAVIGPNSSPGIVLRLRDGTRVPVRALAKEGFVWNAERDRASLEPAAEELNALLASAKQAAAR
jgi:hypothetical protein